MKKNSSNKFFNKLSNEVFDDAFNSGASENSRVKWDDKNRQYYRFSEIYSSIEGLDSSILDIGCGNGEFLNYLNQNGFTGEYLGVDINENLINEAKIRFPNQNFEIKDIFTDEIKQFDYVVMSGLFNLNLGQDTNFINDFIGKMFELCNKKIIFNAISTFVSFKDSTMYYIDPKDLIEFSCTNLSPKFKLTHHFLPYNFTMTIYKNSNWESLAKV